MNETLDKIREHVARYFPFYFFSELIVGIGIPMPSLDPDYLLRYHMGGFLLAIAANTKFIYPAKPRIHAAMFSIGAIITAAYGCKVIYLARHFVFPRGTAAILTAFPLWWIFVYCLGPRLVERKSAWRVSLKSAFIAAVCIACYYQSIGIAEVLLSKHMLISKNPPVSMFLAYHRKVYMLKYAVTSGFVSLFFYISRRIVRAEYSRPVKI